MGNNQQKDSEVSNEYYSLYNNNYLVNCYKYLIRSKTVHFIVTFIEILLNISQELYIFSRSYNLEKNNQNNTLKIILFIPQYL